MKLIVAGSRACGFNPKIYAILEQVDRLVGVSEVISGKAKGADFWGECWAKFSRIPIRAFPANWELYGKRAGYVRNAEMARAGDILVAFWDGASRGTRHMIDLAKEKGLKVIVVRFDMNFVIDRELSSGKNMASREKAQSKGCEQPPLA